MELKIPKEETFLYAYDAENNSIGEENPGKPPLRLRVFLGWLLEYASENSFSDFDYDWVYYNRENFLTFEVVHQNGSAEMFTVSLYIRGSVWNRIKDFVYFAGIFMGIVVLIVIASTAYQRLKGGQNRAKGKCRGLTRGAYLLNVWMLSSLYKPIGLVAVYFLGTALTFRSDFILSWPIYLLLIGSLVLVSSMLFGCRVENRQRTWITGLEWIPPSILPLGDTFFITGIVLTIVFFFLLKFKTLTEGMRRASFIASPIWAGLLGLQVGCSTGILTLLVGLAVLYPLLVLLYAPSPENEEITVEENGMVRVETPGFSVSKTLDTTPPSAKELLARLDSIVRKMEWEEKTLERKKMNNQFGTISSDASRSQLEERDSDWIPFGHALGFTLADYKSIKNQRLTLFDE